MTRHREVHSRLTPNRCPTCAGRLKAATAPKRWDFSRWGLGGFLKFSLSTSVYSLSRRAPDGSKPSRFRHCRDRPPGLGHIGATPSTVLLSAEQATEKLPQIVEGFFFRHRDGQGQRPARRLFVRSAPGLGKTSKTSWSRAPVRHGVDPREALGAVLGVAAEGI